MYFPQIPLPSAFPRFQDPGSDTCGKSVAQAECKLVAALPSMPSVTSNQFYFPGAKPKTDVL